MRAGGGGLAQIASKNTTTLWIDSDACAGVRSDTVSASGLDHSDYCHMVKMTYK